MSETSLKTKTAKGLFWGAMNNGLQQLIGAVLGIVLLGCLTPGDYGIVGKLAIFTSISCGDFMEIWLIWLRASFPSAVTTVILSRDPKRKIKIRIQKDF